MPLMTVKQLQKLLDSGAPPDTLIAVCILASWNPVCQKLEHYQLQAAHWQLQQDPVGSNCSTNGTSTGTGNSGSGSSKADVQNSLGPDAKRIKVRVWTHSVEEGFLPVLDLSIFVGMPPAQMIIMERVERRFRRLHARLASDGLPVVTSSGCAKTPSNKLHLLIAADVQGRWLRNPRAATAVWRPYSTLLSDVLPRPISQCKQ